MRILMSTVVDLKKSMHNRPHQFAYHLSKEHDLTVISINDWWKGAQSSDRRDQVYHSDMFERIEYQYLTNKKIHPFMQEMMFGRWISRMERERAFDVHFSYNSLTISGTSKEGPETVFDIADDLVAMIRDSPQIPRFAGVPASWIGEVILRNNLNNSSWITYTSRRLLERYGFQGKSTLVPNGVDISHFTPNLHSKEELGLSGSFLVGYVGALREWVDFEGVLDAMKMLHDDNVKLLVVGREGEFQRYVGMTRERSLQDRVIFVGAVDYSNVPKYISALDIGLIPFTKGGISDSALPLKLFEYMACEKPVISTRIPGVIDTAGNLVRYADDSSQLVEQIKSLRNDPDSASRLGKEGRRLVESSYDWELISHSLEQILCRFSRCG